jgi:hypothetical protein
MAAIHRRKKRENPVSKPQKEALRVLSEQEQQALQRIVGATSERMDVIKRARALLAVARARVIVLRLERLVLLPPTRSATWWHVSTVRGSSLCSLPQAEDGSRRTARTTGKRLWRRSSRSR